VFFATPSGLLRILSLEQGLSRRNRHMDMIGVLLIR
jgi:hypothetical protein